MTTPELESWLAQAPTSQQETFAELRRLLKSLEPGVVEEIKWGRPCYSTERGLFCYLQSTKHHAVLGFQKGASLNDPEGLLEGTGKEMRHIKFRDGAIWDRAAVTALVQQALNREESGKETGG